MLVCLRQALTQFGKDLGQERWVQVAAVVESRTAVECKARYRKLVKEQKARKERAVPGAESGAVAGAIGGGEGEKEAEAARMARLAGMQPAAAGDDASNASSETAGEPRPGESMAVEGAKVAKLKPSEKRALKKAEKAARMDAKQAKKRAEATAEAGGSDDEGGGGGVGGAAKEAGEGLGWGVIAL